VPAVTVNDPPLIVVEIVPVPPDAVVEIVLVPPKHAMIEFVADTDTAGVKSIVAVAVAKH
jgi:hypothetical protein